MKAVHLMGALLPSGMERMFVSAAPHLDAAGTEHVLVGQGEDQRFVPELEAAGHRVVVIPRVRTASGARAWFRVLRAERPDLVHVHDEAAVAVSVPIARLAVPSAPVVRSIHSEFRPSGRALLSRQVQGRLTNRALAATIAVSPEVRANEVRFGRRASVILNWVDDRYRGMREERVARVARGEVEGGAVVLVGNCAPVKQHALALRALLPTGLALHHVGDERHVDDEERGLLDRLAAEGRLRHRGPGEPGPALLAAGAFLLPSEREGMSLALAEAVAAGVPALVNDHAGSDWARDVPGVRFLGGQQGDWDAALADLGGPPAPVAAEPAIDLSAERGARELLDLYRGVVGARARRR